MANAQSENFFDVLIDRLIVDVRREFEAELREEGAEHPSSPFDPEAKAKKSAPSYDDLVSKMIGFRARLASPTALQQSSYAMSHAPKRFEARAVETAITSAARATVTPKFATAAAEFAFQFIAKAGAKFYPEDVEENGVSFAALKRERRRVLLTLHPDRVPEADRARAHQSFLEAAEAFSILAEAIENSVKTRVHAA